MTNTEDTSAYRGPGRPSKYPWDLWTNGQVHRAYMGKDFTCPPHSFVQYLRNKASELTKIKRTSREIGYEERVHVNLLVHYTSYDDTKQPCTFVEFHFFTPLSDEEIAKHDANTVD